MFAGLLFPWVQVCSHYVSVCRAPSAALSVVILLFAKSVCVCILELLGHQALIWASKVITGHLALKAEYLPYCSSPGKTRESHSCLGCVWGGWVPGIRAHCSQPSASSAVSPAATRGLFWSRAVPLGKQCLLAQSRSYKIKIKLTTYGLWSKLLKFQNQGHDSHGRHVLAFIHSFSSCSWGCLQRRPCSQTSKMLKEDSLCWMGGDVHSKHLVY